MAIDTLPNTKLTVDTITVHNGDTVQTPDGAGTIYGGPICRLSRR